MDRAGLSLAQLRGVDMTTWDPSWWLLGVSCSVLLIGYLGSGYLWGRIVRGLGGPSLPASVSIRLFMVANLGRYVPGKVWQIAGLVAMARRRGVSAATATAAAVLSQGIGLASATLVGLWSLWTVVEGQMWRWVLPAVFLGGVAIGLAPPVFQAALSLWFRVARSEKPEGVTSSDAIEWLALGLGTWVAYSGAFFLLVIGLGLDAHLLPAASAFAAAYVLGYVMVFAPAGLGVREGFLVVLMAPQVGAGVAGAVAVIARLWTTVIEVIPSGVFWARHLVGHAAPEGHE